MTGAYVVGDINWIVSIVQFGPSLTQTLFGSWNSSSDIMENFFHMPVLLGNHVNGVDPNSPDIVYMIKMNGKANEHKYFNILVEFILVYRSFQCKICRLCFQFQITEMECWEYFVTCTTFHRVRYVSELTHCSYASC